MCAAVALLTIVNSITWGLCISARHENRVYPFDFLENKHLHLGFGLVVLVPQPRFTQLVQTEGT